MSTTTLSTPGQQQLAQVRAKMELEDVLTSNHEQISGQVKDFMRREVGLIGRLFPGKMQRLISQSQLMNAKTELDFRHKLLELHVEFNMAALNEKYETYLKVVKVEFRQQFIAFVTQRQQQLRREIDDRRRDYVEDDTERWEFYQKHQNLPSAQHYWQSLEQETMTYFEWLSKLLTDFQNIVDEKIRSYHD
jgi:hypothetical protein